jgi:uncharacterized phage protein (TIGR02218 family)
MKTIPAILQTHLDEQVNTTCLLLRIERNVGAFGTALPVLGVCTLDQDVTYNDGDGAVTYSAMAGFIPSNLSLTGDMGVDNADAEILVPAFDLGPVVEADINAGRYDSAPFVLYRVNYNDLTTGRHEIVMAGTLGQARVVGGLSAFCELRSISQQFKQTVCEVDSLTCRADFGSTACGVDISALWETGTVSAVGTETDRQFSADTALAEGDLKPGIVQFLTGDNAGRSYEIEAHTVTIGGGSGGSPGTDTVFNSADKGADLTLSGSDLIVTRDGTNNNAWRTVRVTNSRNAGKYYFEFDNTTNGATAGSMIAGLCKSTQSLTTYIGATTDGWGLQANNTAGAKSYFNAANTSPFGASFLSAGQNMMVAVDFDAGKIWWGLNGTWVGDPAAGTGNTFSFTPNTALFVGASLFSSAQAVTGCFKTPSFAHSGPSGFAAWGPYGATGGSDLGSVDLTFPTAYPIEVGDTFKWRTECGKHFIRNCKDDWDNALNFRGEPYIPVGDEASLATPGATKPGPNSGSLSDTPWFLTE